MKIVSLCALLLFLPYLIRAQNKSEPIKIKRIDSIITMDGKVDEPVWQQIKPLPLTSHWPEFGNKPTNKSEIRIAYDESYIYLSGICYVAPDTILAASFKRDLFTTGTDYLTIILDTFNDNETALYFATTPTGSRTDVVFTMDSDNVDTNWDTYWDTEAYIFENGWSAEIRIPFSSLGFQEKAGKVIMGIAVNLYTARKNEMNTFPAIEPNWGFWSWAKVSQFQKIAFEDVHSNNPLYMTPYVLAGAGQNFELNDGETAYKRSDELTREIGLDLKYNVTDNLTLDFSLNTDFAQVEADDQQVNLTRFSLFFPEKRRFFLERASIFDFNFGNSNRLFYTRRIGLNDGEQVDMIAGGRLVGRINDWDIGFLNAQTNSREDLAAENFGVIRLRRQILNPYSYIGGMATTRLDDGGTLNAGYGVDGVVRLFDNDYLLFNLAQTYSDTTTAAFNALNFSRGRLLWERRSYGNLGYQLAFERAGKSYNPVNGFEFRDNFTRYFGRLSYGWLLNGHPYLQRHQLAVNAEIFSRNRDNYIESFEVRPSWSGAITSGGFFDVGFSAVHEHLLDDFNLSDDAGVVAGEYTYYSIFAGYETPGGSELSTSINSSYGTFYDGDRFSLSISPKWIASRYIELSGSYQFNYIDFKKRKQELRSHVMRLRSLLTLNTKLSFTAFIQYNSTAHLSLLNGRFRYNPSEGHDLYLVYNEAFNSDRRREIPFLPASRNRTILAKYTYTFIL